MADLSEVRIGSKLVLTLEVTHEAAFPGRRHPFGVRGLYGVALGQDAVWLDTEIIAAAEHIPAPRVFKRGDWVKWNDGEEDFRHCIVLGKSETGHSELLRVDVPGEGVCELYPRFLEPDEAPE